MSQIQLTGGLHYGIIKIIDI